MTDMWARLAEPFPADVVKERPGPRMHDGNCDKPRCRQPHRMLDYVDARAVAQRMDDVLTPAGWDFQVSVVDAVAHVAHGRLVLFVGERAITREDFGYPNSDDDEEPLKSAASDALKRCAVQVGVGRHLYADNKPAKRQDTTPRPSVSQRPSVAPTGDAEWSCPDHGTTRVKEGKRGGWYCATKRDDGTWCEWNDRNTKAIEPRPAPAEVPPPPSEPPADDFDKLPW